ncbi:unnamed protein product, partial [Urochloa humidicola]
EWQRRRGLGAGGHHHHLRPDRRRLLAGGFLGAPARRTLRGRRRGAAGRSGTPTRGLCGPDAFSTVDAICGMACGAGARVLLLTACPDGECPRCQGDVVAHLPAQTMADEEEEAAEGEGASSRAKLPMGSLYEGVGKTLDVE